jgi:hypothetical protein
MSASNVTPFEKPVNREERRLADRVRRMCNRHNLKLRIRRNKQFHFGSRGYQLMSTTVVAGHDFELSLRDVTKIIEALELRSATQDHANREKL